MKTQIFIILIAISLISCKKEELTNENPLSSFVFVNEYPCWGANPLRANIIFDDKEFILCEKLALRDSIVVPTFSKKFKLKIWRGTIWKEKIGWTEYKWVISSRTYDVPNKRFEFDMLYENDFIYHP